MINVQIAEVTLDSAKGQSISGSAGVCGEAAGVGWGGRWRRPPRERECTEC